MLIDEWIYFGQQDYICGRLVKRNELIYNKYNEDYKSIEKKEAAWLQIAREMGVTDSDCRRRWTCLREQYTKENRRLTALSNNGMTTSRLWPLLEEMEFLKEHIVKKKRCVLGTSSYSVKSKEPSTQFTPEPYATTVQEDAIEYEFVAEPFQFESAASPSIKPDIEQEEIDALLPTKTQSSTPFTTAFNSSQFHEAGASHLKAANSKKQSRICKKRQHEPHIRSDLSTALEMLKEVCGAATMRRQNPALYGFGQMIVETISEMSAQKQAIAMQKVTELVMNLKMEPEAM